MAVGMERSIPRTEDLRMVTGHGRYVDDLPIRDPLHAFIVRSPHPHARFRVKDISQALAAPRVAGVFVGEDLAADGIGPLRYPAALTNLDGSAIHVTPRRAIALDVARHAGEAVAVVVAETAAAAQDAAELVEVDYEELPGVVGVRAATAPGAPLIWPEARDNIAYHWQTGDREAVDRVFAEAYRICTVKLIHNRLVAASLEPRGAIAVHDPAEDRLHLYAGLQDPQSTHSVLAATGIVSHGAQLRVVVPDVGGGFGMKNYAYPEYLALLWLARRLGRPVKWVAGRGESFLTDDQGRGHEGAVSLAVDREGRFLAIRMRFQSELGAYLTTSGSRVATLVGSRCATGAYAIPLFHVETRGVFTNATPSGSYRGAGKPEFIYMLERAVDTAADELGMDRIELRRRNLVAPEHIPYRTAMGDVIDSGDFPGNLERALAYADFAGFAERRAQARANGRIRGLGISIYAEHDGLKDGRARIVFDPTGSVRVSVSAQSNGQGHETAFAQIAAEELGLRFEDIRVFQGDAEQTGFGAGTGGSRSITLCGTAIHLAAQRILDKARGIAAHMLGASPEQALYENGLFRAPPSNETLTLRDVARASYIVQNLPPGFDLGLEADGHYGTNVPNFSSGCHVCEIEIDPETGRTGIVRYTCVDDFGRLVNPMLVAGQVHGGVAQGIGQALYEGCVYDEASGQLLSASFMDYCLPRASDLPPVDQHVCSTECRTNPLGVKACGEAGTTAAPPAVMNAIADALAFLGRRIDVDMPATPEQVWRACREAVSSRREAVPAGSA